MDWKTAGHKGISKLHKCEGTRRHMLRMGAVCTHTSLPTGSAAPLTEETARRRFTHGLQSLCLAENLLLLTCKLAEAQLQPSQATWSSSKRAMLLPEAVTWVSAVTCEAPNEDKSSVQLATKTSCPEAIFTCSNLCAVVDDVCYHDVAAMVPNARQERVFIGRPAIRSQDRIQAV